MADPIRPFKLSVPDTVLADLQWRLAHTRWPEKETVEDWSQGAPLAKMRELVDYWQNRYNWRRCESMLNGLGQYQTKIEGLDIHFLHIKSSHATAFPLIVTHGWPGSIIEFHKVIGPLVDPVAHGGEASDSFDLVVPSLPGYGFSEKPAAVGWNIERIARVWVVLMERLGYKHYGAQGGDWGAGITTLMGHYAPKGLAGIHLNVPICFPDGNDPDPAAVPMLKSMAEYEHWESAYARQQATRPQTLGYGLADSPVGQAAWIYEKFKAWADCGGSAENIFTLDEMLDNIMLYWLSNSGASSGRLYWESFFRSFGGKEVAVPSGFSLFPKELFAPARVLVERYYKNVVYWKELAVGGHFAALEQPTAFIEGVRDCFRLIR